MGSVGWSLRRALWALAAACAVASTTAAGAESVAARVRPQDLQRFSSDSRADSLAVAMLAVNARARAALRPDGPGMRRLLRERLAHDPGVPLPGGPEVFDELLADGGRLPIAVAEPTPPCPRCPYDPAGALLDAMTERTASFARGGGGPRLELRDVEWTRDVRTIVTGRIHSAYVAGRTEQRNPEFERLKVRLLVALDDRRRAEEDERNETGFLGLLATLSASARNGEVKGLSRDLERTPPFLHQDVVETYALDVTEARAVGTLTARIVMSDPATGWSDSLLVSGVARQRADGLRGVRPGDTHAHVERDAEAQLPSERELFARALDELCAGASAPVESLAARAAVRRAFRERDRGRGGEALGWLLLALDCGGEPPAESGWAAALVRVNATPYERLAEVRLAPFRAPGR